MSDLLLQGLTSKALTDVGLCTAYKKGAGWWADVLNKKQPAKFWLSGIFAQASNKFDKTGLLINFKNSSDLFEYIECVGKKIPSGALSGRWENTQWKNAVSGGSGFVNLLTIKEEIVAKLWDFTSGSPVEREWIYLEPGDLLNMYLSFTVSCSEKGLSVKMTLSQAKLLSRGNKVESPLVPDAPPELTKEEQELIELYQKEEALKKVKVESD